MVSFMYFFVYVDDNEIEVMLKLMGVELLLLINRRFYLGIMIVDGIWYVKVRLLEYMILFFYILKF